MSKIYDNGTYRELTAEEIKQQQVEERKQYQSMSYDETVELLIRRRYSYGKELSLQRQRYEKPNEFAEYYNYCEMCKTEAKNLLKL